MPRPWPKERSPRSSVTGPALRGFMYGLQFSRPTAATVKVEAGRCLDADNEVTMVVDSALTVDITASGALGLDTGSESSSTWYYVWVVGKVGGTTSAILSASSTSPTMPSGYQYKRRIGSVFNDSSSDLVVVYGRPVQRTYIKGPHGTPSFFVSGCGTTLTELDLSSYVPPTATHALVDMQMRGNTTSYHTCDLYIDGGSNYIIRQAIQTTAWQRNTACQLVAFEQVQQMHYNSSFNGDLHVKIHSWMEEI